LGRRDLLERAARGLLVVALDARGRAAIELPRPLGREDDEQVTVRHLVECAFQRGERHHLDTSRSGKVRPSRAVRQRSAWMIEAKCTVAHSANSPRPSIARNDASSTKRKSTPSISPGRGARVVTETE